LPESAGPEDRDQLAGAERTRYVIEDAPRSPHLIAQGRRSRRGQKRWRPTAQPPIVEIDLQKGALDADAIAVLQALPLDRRALEPGQARRAEIAHLPAAIDRLDDCVPLADRQIGKPHVVRWSAADGHGFQFRARLSTAPSRRSPQRASTSRYAGRSTSSCPATCSMKRPRGDRGKPSTAATANSPSRMARRSSAGSTVRRVN